MSDSSFDSMSEQYHYRVIESISELQQAVDLELVVWGLDPRDAVPVYMMHAVVHSGGMTIGAFPVEDERRMVGMAFAFPARRGDEVFLWSHMAGVHPDYQRRGIGYGLKIAQRSWALENGYTTLRWTCDPLQSGNGHFNIGILGAIANFYYEDFYGAMDDDINRGMPSDRVEAEWDLRNPVGKSEWLQPTPPRLIDFGGNEIQAILPDVWDKLAYYTPLPPDLSALRRENPSCVLQWRMALRAALQTAFAQGYIVSGFIKSDADCGYIVERQRR